MGKKKKTTIGYKYFMGLHMGLCRGPLDVLREIRVGNKRAWTGNITTSTEIQIDQPELFGGEEQEGGIQGTLAVLMGEATQPRHARLAQMLGGLVSAFRGVATAYFDGMVCAMSPYPKEWSFRVRRITKGWHNDAPWYPEKAAIKMGTRKIIDASDRYWRWLAVPNSDSNNRAAIGFDDSAWAQGKAPFGSAEWVDMGFDNPSDHGFSNHPATVVPQAKKVWMRTTLNLGEVPEGLRFQAFVDNDCRLYVNGKLVLTVGGVNGAYYDVALPMDSFVVGDNVIAAEGWDRHSGAGNWFWFDWRIVAGFEDDLCGMNPAHILYQIYTDPRIGRGLPASRFDDVAWRAAADVFYQEGFGLCLSWSRSSSLSDFAQQVINHAGAAIYTSRRTGLLVLKPIRADYELDDLPLFTPDTGLLGIDDDAASSQSGGINEVIVKYHDPFDHLDKSVREKNLGAILAADSVTTSESIDYPGIPTEALARRVALRDLKAKSGFIKRFSVRLDRRGRDITPAGVFRVSDPARGIENMVLRAGRCEYGTQTDGTITITGLQDVFGLPATVYRKPEESGYIAPDATPHAPLYQRVMECTYRDLVQRVGERDADALDPATGFLHAMAVRPRSSAMSFQLDTRVAPAEFKSQEVAGAFCPGGVLAADISPSATEVEFSTVVDLQYLEVGTAALLGDEIVRIDAVDTSAGKVTIARGCIDTVPVEHAAGTVLFFYDNWGAEDLTEYVQSVSVDAQLRTRTSAGLLASASATVQSQLFQSRANRPYPPGQLLLNGQGWPQMVVGDLVVSWAHRDRLTQSDELIDFSQASIGPESGTKYGIELYDTDTDTQVFALTDISGVSATIPSGNLVHSNRLELYSVRAGVKSLQRHLREFLSGFEITVNAPGSTANLEVYSGTLMASGATAPVSWSIVAGALPAGLHLSSSAGTSGTIDGVANATVGSYAVTVMAQDALGIAVEKTLSINVVAARSVIALLHMEGADNSKSFPDETSKVWTVNGDAKITTTAPPFGTSSGLFDGTGDSLSTTHNDFAFGGVDFTWEAWIRPLAATQTYHIIFDTRNTSGQMGMLVWINDTRQLRAWANTPGADMTGTVAVPLNAWSHIALTRSGGSLRLFLNGELVAPVLNGSGVLNSDRAFVAQTQEGGNNFNGQIKDLRLIAGTCLYTGSFTPSAQPHPNPAAALAISLNGSLPQGTAGTAYSSATDIMIKGSNAPFTCTVDSGVLPVGWSAAVSGTAVTVAGPGVAAGNHTFTLKVTDSLGNSATLPLTLMISAGLAPIDAIDTYLFDGEQFIAAQVLDGYTRFYNSQDGKVFEYLGGIAGANMFSKFEAAISKGANCYASFPKYYAATGNTSGWYSTTIPDFARSSPPQPWTSAPIAGALPLCISWDADNSRFVRIMDDKTVTWSADGLSWSTLGGMLLPDLHAGWTWYTGMRMELFRSDGYWYALHSALSSRFQADSTLLMRSADLLGPWEVCPGTGFYSPPEGVAAWDFFMLTGVAVRGATMIITASGRRSTPANASSRQLILRSTDGLTFSLVYEASAYNLQGYNDFTEVKPVGANGFVATGAGGLLVSSDDGLTWSRTALAPAPTALRSDGQVVVGTRATGANGAAEAWHTADGQTWSKSTVRRYNSGQHRHWRLRAIKAAGDVTFGHLAFFSGATKLTDYTKSQGAGTGLANVDNADAATFWLATATELAAGSAWVAYDFGSAQDVTAVKLQAPSGDNSRMPSIVEIEASEDGVNWRPVWFEAGLTWSAGESKTLAKTA
ncbi:LamG-like jellyroll fold domain-containing protein [Comamonas testosteroni]|uniref:Ig family protein n=1 Tax=Comamonas testosteroni (strain DSM 14576 / KF-1) TaxID=399795 RepID=B7WXW3_COMTK|nr:LamG-like jellyroll fold domain-containing protein [Comamonas testosteroni]EED67965.1 Ig family protein [Comamonas testosteroni KF-1]WQG66083.1 LamG-like jellyroll fold domain-containing protein [Comamonas testosteroni]